MLSLVFAFPKCSLPFFAFKIIGEKKNFFVCDVILELCIVSKNDQKRIFFSFALDLSKLTYIRFWSKRVVKTNEVLVLSF